MIDMEISRFETIFERYAMTESGISCPWSRSKWFSAKQCPVKPLGG